MGRESQEWNVGAQLSPTHPEPPSVLPASLRPHGSCMVRWEVLQGFLVDSKAGEGGRGGRGLPVEQDCSPQCFQPLPAPRSLFLLPARLTRRQNLA